MQKSKHKNKDGLTPLHFAAQNGHTGVVDKLLAKGAKVNTKNKGGFTALHLAAQNGHTGVVSFFAS